jgi:hypothetical protein
MGSGSNHLRDNRTKMPPDAEKMKDNLDYFGTRCSAVRVFSAQRLVQ